MSYGILWRWRRVSRYNFSTAFHFFCHLSKTGLFALTNYEAQSIARYKTFLTWLKPFVWIPYFLIGCTRIMHVKKHGLTTIYHIFFSKDINECDPSELSSKYQHLAHICHDDANCTNTNGSYYCTCLRGYSGSGEHCTGKVTYKVTFQTERVSGK